MLNISCSCGQKGYFDWMGEINKNNIILSLDIDTMNLEFNDTEGLKITCPHCKTIYNIIRVQ